VAVLLTVHTCRQDAATRNWRRDVEMQERSRDVHKIMFDAKISLPSMGCLIIGLRIQFAACRPPCDIREKHIRNKVTASEIIPALSI
jgi:hypothetical protein